MAKFVIQTACVSAGTVCEYKNCKQEAVYEMFLMKQILKIALQNTAAKSISNDDNKDHAGIT
jgi:hypothetical protein